jgi:hypothetical protein
MQNYFQNCFEPTEQEKESIYSPSTVHLQSYKLSFQGYRLLRTRRLEMEVFFRTVTPHSFSADALWNATVLPGCKKLDINLHADVCP